MLLGISAAEWLGYLASVTVGASLMMDDMTRLRVINLIGCILFVVYGVWIAAYPVAALNLFGAGVNIFHLYKMRRAA